MFLHVLLHFGRQLGRFERNLNLHALPYHPVFLMAMMRFLF